MFATLARKHYLREPCLLARTTNMNLRTTNFRLLHFISLIRSLVASLSRLPFFLSMMDDLPRGIIMNKGLNKKTLLFFPLLLLPVILLSLYPSFHPVLFMESFTHFLKDFLSFLSSIPSPILLPLCFSWKVSNMQWKLCPHNVKIEHFAIAKESFRYKLCNHHLFH